MTRLTETGNGVTHKRVDMSYDAASQMIGVTRYADLLGTQLVAASNYVYDPAGRLINLTHEKGTNILADYAWVYDTANRIIKFSSTDGISEYNYDNRYQLIEANYDYQTDEDYSYDKNGNRINNGYVTGENNQLLSDGVYNYEYDAEGNLIRQTEIATLQREELTWDYRNRLTKVVFTDSSGNIIKSAEYSYDVFDRRIEKSIDADGDGAVSSIVERFVYDGDHIALVFDGEGNQIHRYLHGTQIDQILADEQANGKVVWALTDHQGTVRDIIDSQGILINHLTYDSFGQIKSESSSNIDFRFGYTGRELDKETGLYYYRARYYNSATGRFLSEDPIEFSAGDVNLYRYVGNSPLNAIDLFGLVSANLTKLLGLACPGSSGGSSARVCDNYPLAKTYSQALATARAWFYAITTSSIGTANINLTSSIPRTSPSTLPRWILTLPLIDDDKKYPFDYRGKATLRPGGTSGGIPTIDLTKDDNKQTHATPQYPNITEVKFKYAGKENKDPKPHCPQITPTANDREAGDRLINDDIRHPQKRPDGKPVPVPVSPIQQKPSSSNKDIPWWQIIGGGAAIIIILFGGEETRKDEQQQRQ